MGRDVIMSRYMRVLVHHLSGWARLMYASANCDHLHNLQEMWAACQIKAELSACSQSHHCPHLTHPRARRHCPHLAAPDHVNWRVGDISTTLRQYISPSVGSRKLCYRTVERQSADIRLLWGYRGLRMSALLRLWRVSVKPMLVQDRECCICVTLRWLEIVAS